MSDKILSLYKKFNKTCFVLIWMSAFNKLNADRKYAIWAIGFGFNVFIFLTKMINFNN